MPSYLKPLTPELLTRIGVALYGPNGWRAPLARAVDRSQRTVQFWLNGRTPPESVMKRLREILRERGGDLKKLLDDTIN